MDDRLIRAQTALYEKDGKTALQLTDEILESDEHNSQAWFLAMQCFQFLYPIDGYDAENELTCARYAIRFAAPKEKYRMKKQVYLFFLEKILTVLQRDADVLADGKELLGFYQRTVYFDAAGAAEKTRAHDESVMSAVQKSFAYCEALFDFIPDSAIRASRELSNKATEVAQAWKRTYGFVAMRVGLYHLELTQEQISGAKDRYARYLRAVKNGEEILKETVFL